MDSMAVFQNRFLTRAEFWDGSNFCYGHIAPKFTVSGDVSLFLHKLRHDEPYFTNFQTRIKVDTVGQYTGINLPCADGVAVPDDMPLIYKDGECPVFEGDFFEKVDVQSTRRTLFKVVFDQRRGFCVHNARGEGSQNMCVPLNEVCSILQRDLHGTIVAHTGKNAIQDKDYPQEWAEQYKGNK